jgi:hypothetical protein
LYPIGVAAAPTKVHPHVAAIGPAQVRKHLRERREATLLLAGAPEQRSVGSAALQAIDRRQWSTTRPRDLIHVHTHSGAWLLGNGGQDGQAVCESGHESTRD